MKSRRKFKSILDYRFMGELFFQEDKTYTLDHITINPSGERRYFFKEYAIVMWECEIESFFIEVTFKYGK